MASTRHLPNGRHFGRHSPLGRAAESLRARWRFWRCYGAYKRQACRFTYRKRIRHFNPLVNAKMLQNWYEIPQRWRRLRIEAIGLSFIVAECAALDIVCIYLIPVSRFIVMLNASNIIVYIAESQSRSLGTSGRFRWRLPHLSDRAAAL